MIEVGAIYSADFEDAGPHPVIVVSRAALNRGRYAVVVVCTSARFQQRRELPNCVPFLSGEYGFTTDCVAQCENILSVELSRLDLDRGPRGMRRREFVPRKSLPRPSAARQAGCRQVAKRRLQPFGLSVTSTSPCPARSCSTTLAHSGLNH